MWGLHKLGSARSDRLARDSSPDRPAVVIVGPPWIWSGTARVIQNQIKYYQDRGYLTVFIAVAISPGSMRSTFFDPAKLTEGLRDLGADHVLVAELNQRSYTAAKYRGSFRHALRGTALDWIVEIGRAAQLSNDLKGFIRKLPVALIHVNHVFSLGFARRLRAESVGDSDRVPIILETHDIQSRALHERRELNPWRCRPDSLKRLIRSETALLNKADVLVHCSLDDSDFFKIQMPNKPQVLVMPTIDRTFVSTVKAACAPSSIDTIDLLFIGQFHGPNLAGLTWFFEEVWPFIADRQYNLKVVGAVDLMVRGSLPQIYKAFRPCFVGQVADLAPYYRAARCAIAPMVSGSGISIKTIEALALGKPFVGTSKAFRGMPMDEIERAGLRAYDTPQAFAEAIVHALSSQHLSGASSRTAYERIFSEQAAFASRDEVIRIAHDSGREERTGLSATIIHSS